MIVPAAVLVGALLAGSVAGGGDTPVRGLTIGAPIAAVMQALGPPTAVMSLDNGNRFAFGPQTAAYVDADGQVLAIDLRAGTPVIAIEGNARTFPIGTFTVAQAAAELADVAEFAGPAFRSYRLGPRRDLVLGFTGSADLDRLNRLSYGEPGQLARLGLLPGDSAVKSVPYRAPRLTRPAAAALAEDASNAVYRLDIDRGGAVTSVAAVGSTAAPAVDDAQLQRLRARRYACATLGGRPIGATIFVQAGN